MKKDSVLTIKTSLPRRFVVLFTLLVIGAFLAEGLMLRDNFPQGGSKCGDALPLEIRYRFDGPSSSVPPQYPNPTVFLSAVLQEVDRSVVVIRVERPHQGPVQYASYDRGRTWQTCNWKLGYTNLKNWSMAERLMSRANRKVLYDCYYKCKDGFELSTDAGHSWQHVTPALLGGAVVKQIELIETGMRSTGRVYARIWTEGRDPVVAVSEDNGWSFTALANEIGGLVEARADPKVMYCSQPSRGMLGISLDGGSNWAEMAGSAEFWRPLYFSPVRRDIRSWKEYPEDREYAQVSFIDQIESDPFHADWIYILTYKGLYFSRDAGHTFRLTSLVKGRIKAIDKIAVDPADGRYIYASVDLGHIYRSSDYGCTWEEMKFALPADK